MNNNNDDFKSLEFFFGELLIVQENHFKSILIETLVKIVERLRLNTELPVLPLANLNLNYFLKNYILK